jgi:hypothetical protein
MPTAAGYFPKVSSQSSKENLCDEVPRNRTGITSSSSKSRQKAALGTPLKKFSRSVDYEESMLQESFQTPNRPEGNAQSKRRSVNCGSTKRNNAEKFTLEVTPKQISKECPEFDVTEELHSLRKEKSQLEAQNCDLEVNFAQVKSQLEAVLLYKEVVQLVL